MVTAERWYEYQDNYKKYGLEMKAPVERQVKPKSKTFSSIDRGRLMAYIVIMGIILVGIVTASAYTAGLNYEINNMRAANDEIAQDIELLTVELKTATNVAVIEEKAINDLGMVYPAAGSIVYISKETEPVTDFAMLLKEQAYNQ